MLLKLLTLATAWGWYVDQERGTECQEGKVRISNTAPRKELKSQKEQQTSELPPYVVHQQHATPCTRREIMDTSK